MVDSLFLQEGENPVFEDVPKQWVGLWLFKAIASLGCRTEGPSVV